MVADRSCYYLAVRSENDPDGQRPPSFIEAARRAQIVQCAIDTIAELGYGRASLARIAGRAGVSKGVISYHFAGKDDLIEQVVASVLEAARAEMIPAIEAEPTARGKLRAYIESNLGFMRTHERAVRALVEIASGSAPEGVPTLDLIGREDAVAALQRILRLGQQSGEFEDFSTRVMAVSIRSAIDAVPAQLMADPDLNVEGYARELADLFDRASAGRA